jgi:hypothetical protein
MDVEPEQAEKAVSTSSAGAEIRPLSGAFLAESGIWSLFVFVVVIRKRIEEVYLASLPLVRCRSVGSFARATGAAGDASLR